PPPCLAWARDEPPSPYDQDAPAGASRDHLSDQARPSIDVASFQSSLPDDQVAGPSRWWAFTRHRPDGSLTSPLSPRQPSQEDSSWRGSHNRERSRSIAWLASSISRRPNEDGSAKGKDPESLSRIPEAPSRANTSGMHLDLPAPDPVITLAQNKTPGWDTPWSPRPPNDLISRHAPNGNAEHGSSQHSDNEKEMLSPWQRRRKRFRVYILTNVYVPLLFRFINITFTTAALAIAIRIRINEKHHGLTGAVGSSPTLVIIFAPLTLVHVMVAIYLEYFGRPLGLWRTSGKLAHTLLEVVFICAWSAALALCFDNFFTSIIPCASPESTEWYNDLPRTSAINVPTDVGHLVCEEQLALICLVGVGLIMYCYNLVISLFRIFEKVKYHHPTSLTVT
ncbi:hypothetical protein K474DRAFT_1590015, partial [Panus rudis PR-1116 ss-1]